MVETSHSVTKDEPALVEEVEPVIKNQSVRFSVIQGEGGGEEFGAYQRRYSMADNQADALASLWKAVDNADSLGVAMAIKTCKTAAVDIDEPRKSDGVTPLAVAASRGDVASLKCLLKQGANPDLTLVNGSSILYLAARQGKSEVVKLLVEAGAPVDKPKKSTGATPLMAACRSGAKETVDTLLELGANPAVKCPDGTTCLYVAAQGDFCDIITTLCGKGADVNSARLKGSTALFIASQKGRKDTVKLLMDLDAKLDVKTDDGATPVVAAAQNGHVEVVRMLVGKGADVKLPWKQGITALFLAAQEGHEEMARLLVEELNHPVEVAEDKHGFTPVFAAAQKGHMNVLEVLAKGGANLDVISKPGLSPIMVASQQGQAKTVEWLADKGCLLHRTLPSGATALFLAAQNGHASTVQSLIYADKKHGTSEVLLMDLAREDGCTPAYIAALGGHYDVIDVLGQKGANLRLPNQDGLTPFDAALESPFRAQTIGSLAAHGVHRPTMLSSVCSSLCGSNIGQPARRSSAGEASGAGGGSSSKSASSGQSAAPSTSQLEETPDVAAQGVSDVSVRDSITGV